MKSRVLALSLALALLISTAYAVPGEDGTEYDPSVAFVSAHGIMTALDSGSAAASEPITAESANFTLLIYDASTLTLLKSISLDLSGGQHECSGIAVEKAKGICTVCSWGFRSHNCCLYQYDLETGEFRQKIKLSGAPNFIQGVAFHNGRYYLSADDGCESNGRADHVYAVSVVPGGTDAVAYPVKELSDLCLTTGGHIDAFSLSSVVRSDRTVGRAHLGERDT